MIDNDFAPFSLKSKKRNAMNLHFCKFNNNDKLVHLLIPLCQYVSYILISSNKPFMLRSNLKGIEIFKNEKIAYNYSKYKFWKVLKILFNLNKTINNL